MEIGVLIIGDELLSGRRQDRHLAHAIGALAARGLELVWARYAGDDEALLVREFRAIRATNALCLAFGGIGATPDDRTRQAVAAAHDVPLTRHAEAAREIEAAFGDGAYPHRILMADLPQGANIIPNPYNRIPGFSIGHIHCLPGFPEMAWPMFEWVLDTHYPHLKREPQAQYTVTVHNAHESDLVELMQTLQAKHPTIKISSLPRFLDDGGREVELGIRGDANAAAAAYAELQQTLASRRADFGVVG